MQATVGAATVRARGARGGVSPPPLGWRRWTENGRRGRSRRRRPAVYRRTLQSAATHCSVVPEPVVDWAHPAPDAEREIARGRGGRPQAVSATDGRIGGSCPYTPDSPSQATEEVEPPAGALDEGLGGPPEAGAVHCVMVVALAGEAAITASTVMPAKVPIRRMSPKMEPAHVP